MNVLFHRGCNGWAVYSKENIDAESARNVHVAEVKISTDPATGSTTIRPNDKLETVCGLQTLIAKGRKNLFYSENDVDIRNKMVELQNMGIEVCGCCASHFYADIE